jgi:hypothetical protein
MTAEGRIAHRREVIRVADLTVVRPFIEGHAFEDCLILGPAVLQLADENELIECSFDGDPVGILWVIPPDRPYTIGAVGVRNCSFVGCRFSQIGFAGDAGFAEMFLGGSDGHS